VNIQVEEKEKKKNQGKTATAFDQP